MDVMRSIWDELTLLYSLKKGESFFGSKGFKESLKKYLDKNPMNMNMNIHPGHAHLYSAVLTKEVGKVKEILCHF